MNTKKMFKNIIVCPSCGKEMDINLSLSPTDRGCINCGFIGKPVRKEVEITDWHILYPGQKKYKCKRKCCNRFTPNNKGFCSDYCKEQHKKEKVQ